VEIISGQHDGVDAGRGGTLFAQDFGHGERAMTSQGTLVMAWSPWTLGLALGLWVATAVFSWIAWRRSGFRRSVLALESLRLFAAALAGLLLNQPEWVEQFRPDQRPVVAVLVDDTGSMETRDAIQLPGSTNPNAPGGPIAGPTTRRQQVAPLVETSTWASLDSQMEVVVQKIEGQETDLSAALVDILQRHPSLLGVVLASDGDWNVGAAPVQAAGRYRAAQIPVYTIAAGSETRLPDVELISFDLPTFAISGKSVRIPFTIDSSLPRDQVATVTVRTSAGESITKEVRIAAMGRTSDAVVWKPTDIGDQTLTLEIPPIVGELIADNNSRTAPISIREERLRVLVVESVPRWEYRYLRNALSRDPGVEVSCLLFHPDLEKVGGGNADYIESFPEGRDQLAEFDVVFLGDVGVGDGQLTDQQCQLLKGLVEQQASGLVFIPGWQGRQMSLLETPLADLYPVTLDTLQPGGWGSRTPNHFELTDLGRRSLLTKLADTEEDNIEVWENLPGFQWYAPVLRAKPGTDVLSVHGEVTNQYGRLPLLATRTYGAGKVLFMGTDGAWRWRKGVEDLYHYRFWGQVVRWMAYRRNMAQGATMRLYYTPEQPQVRRTVALTANVMEKNGEPLSGGDVVAKIVAPSGRSESVRMFASGDAWGAFGGSFTPREAGNHALTLFCQQTGESLSANLFVQGTDLERVGKPARPEVLEEIARLTRGRELRIDKLDEIVQSLATLPTPPPMVRRVQLWSHPLVAGLMIGLLGMFWIGRKIVGLI
jgi:hypothetical protein